ncbi:flagellar biosynthetic protein FliO [Bosea sp. (in: a-proteobacteria)]|uniref:flagellar biosynthetic protein FliO n=1 Tax=Bosea sp. (in: a-proteobacteria) TaxID=1871050 RepID=UPI001207A097|nr:flagellar biosynthetic protein FliO [Bosea sp. (in: a-proteobacteria)]TAJ30907.1 MAG: hypothetical protein EPO59_09775 [Bosea sp. (in: a-proteobacteria)]
MQSLFGLELTTAQKVIVASVVILVLLALLGLFVRQIQGGRLKVPGQAGGRQRQPRLGIVDTYDLDRQRQLVLIRRDNVEHLVMVGGASDVVIESNIMRGSARSTTPMFSEAAAQDRPLPPFETLVPPSEPALRAGDELRRAGVSADASEIAAPAPMRSPQAIAETAIPAAAAGAGFAAVGAASRAPSAAAPPLQPPMMSGQPPSFAREHAPAPAVSPGELDDMTRQLEAALKRPFSAVRPANLPDEAPAEMAPAPVIVTPPPAKPPVAPQPSLAKPTDARQADAKATDARPADAKPAMAPKAAEPAPAPLKPQAMLDMEAELEAALGLKPKQAEPGAAASKAAEPRIVEPRVPEPRPVAFDPPPAPVASGPKPAEPAPPAAKPAAPVQQPSVAAPEPAALVQDEPEAAAEPAKAEAVKAEPEKPAEPAKELDPFSVDAIEAEFARLLGRDTKRKS